MTALFLSPVAPRSVASFSADRSYRYTLTRRWDASRPPMTWLMLNPSTADEYRDDPTIRRCMGFAHREDCGGVQILNLFAYRSAYPRRLLTADDPNGPLNRKVVMGAVSNALKSEWPVVVAWGAWPKVERSEVYQWLTDDGAPPVLCLGTTKSGAPRHPLFVTGDTSLVPWTPTP